jgi:integrase
MPPITEKAGLGQDWTPRELRHTFVSLLPDSGVPVEQIADAVGHASTRTTEVVYRHQLRPVTRTAAIALGPLFESRGKTNGGQS